MGRIAANTPHLVLDELAGRSPIPMVSTMEATADEVAARGLQRVGLPGTRFTMQGRFYPEVFSRRGLSLVVPGAEDPADIHGKYCARKPAGESIHLRQFQTRAPRAGLAVAVGMFLILWMKPKVW